MPVRLAQVSRHDRGAKIRTQEMTDALHALLEGSVDYAGLFPPAGLAMRAAVSGYAEYLDSQDAWMLGRFVVPIARLEEFEAERLAVAGSSKFWRGGGLTGSDAVGDIAAAIEVNRPGGTGAIVDSLETKLADIEDVRRVAARLPGDMELYVEVPVHEDPESFIRGIANVGAKAKIRTGGVAPSAFPTSAEVARFMRCCIE